MTEHTGLINDFVEIKTKIIGAKDPLETSYYTGILDLFETHLQKLFNDPNNLKQYGIDVYRIKIGDKLKIFPSKWTTKFCDEKGLPIGDDYNVEYEIADLIVDYYSKNPNNDSNSPLLEMTINLRRI